MTVKTATDLEQARRILRESLAKTEQQGADEIRRIVADAKENHGFLFLRGYEATSGGVSDICLQPLGENGYHRLIQESIDWLKNAEMPSEAFGMPIPLEVWQQAINEQLESWETTLDGGHGRKSSKEKISKGFYDNAASDCVALFNCVIVWRKVLIEKTESEKAKKTPKSLLAKAKAHIRNAAPVGKYQATFNLRPGQFKRLAWNHQTIEIV